MSADDFLGMKSGSAWSRGNDELGGLPAPVKKQGPVDTLVYPLDVGTQQFYPESIKFTVYERESASMEAVQAEMKKAWKKLGTEAEKIHSTARPRTQEALNTWNDRNNAIQAVKSESATERHLKTLTEYLMKETYAGDIYEGVTATLKTATAGLRQTHIDNAKQLANIYLNMPNEISFAEPVAWEGTDLGTFGAMAKTSGSAWEAGVVGNLGNLVGGGSGALAGILGKHFSKIPGLGMMSGAVLGSLGGNTVQKMFESSFGNIANPYKEMTFSGIGFREFSFNFVFRARNEAEVNVVQDIIQTFRYYSKPLYSKGESGFFSYPEEFHIEFLIKQKADIYSDVLDSRFVSNPYIPQIKMCVLKTINTNFAAQNAWRSLQNGAPVEISLALTFVETELVTGEDVIGATNVGRFAGTEKEF